jgi:uncharacterized protein (UPF0218 family)
MEKVLLETVVPHEDLDHWPVMEFAIVSNVWIKMMTFRKRGDTMAGHKHVFDHATMLSQGSLAVLVEGEETTFTAPAIIFIERNKIHKLIAMEDNTVASCIHAIRDGEAIEDIVSEDMIPKGSNPRTAITDLKLTPLVIKDL